MLVELSYALSPEMPVFPGLPFDEFIAHSRMAAGAESNTTMVKHFLHNGTHVDAPFHFYDKGKTIDEIPVADFAYAKPLLIQRKLAKGELLGAGDLRACGDSLEVADLLLICTGYHELRSEGARYADDFPSLSVEAARFIRTSLPRAKAVAIDTLSIESAVLGPIQGFPVHKALLDGELYPQRSLLIFEDVNLLPVLGRSIGRVYAFPLRFTRLDASPVAMVAEVE